MDVKKIAILFLALLGLAAAYFFSERREADKSRREEVILAAGFDAAKAAAVTIASPGKDIISLKKEGDVWKVASGKKSYAADGASVTSLLKQIGGLKSATAVSKNPKSFESFELSDDKAVSVKIEDGAGGVLAWVLLGKNGPDIFSTYVRAHGADAAYLVPGILKGAADRDLAGWRDKALFKMPAEKITLYTVSGDRNLQLRKTNTGGWQSVCDGRVEECPDCASIISGFAGLAAADFADSAPDKAKLDKPVRTITALAADGTRQTLHLGGDKNAMQQFAKTGNGEQVYVLEKSQVEGLAPTCRQLKDSGKPPEGADVKPAGFGAGTPPAAGAEKAK